MRLLCSGNLGVPLLTIRVHPSRKRLVCFSASRDEAALWSWESGHLERLAQLGPPRDYRPTRRILIGGREWELPRNGLARDVAFHPDGVHMVTVGEGRPIEVYRADDGKLVRAIADISAPVDVMASHGFAENPWEVPAEHQGFHRIVFADSGRVVVAGGIGQPRAQVYDFETGAMVGLLWYGFRPYAVHPQGETVSMVVEDQGGADMRFMRLGTSFQRVDREIGWGPPRVRVSDEEDKWGWGIPSVLEICSMVFSPHGNAFALSGDAPESGDRTMALSVHDFPSLRTRFVRDVVLGEGMSSELLPVPWWRTIQPFAFGPGGRRLYALSGTAFISILDSLTGEEMIRWEAHAGLVSTLDIQQRSGTLVSGALDGEVIAWKLSRRKRG